jgi:carbonic anhydrase
MFDDLVDANAGYAAAFDLAGIPARAAKQFALVTCMDSRIEPLAMLGLFPGDAKIMRNAGGRVTSDALRSLVLAVNLLDVRRIAVMQHTGCAMAHKTDEELKALLPAGAEEWELLAMPDPDRSLQEDVERVRACPLIPGEVEVEGWRYQVETGLVERLVRR